MIDHHPDIDLLLDYAAGTLSEGVALTVASHESLCKTCARQISRIEAVGGTMIEECAAAAMSDASLDAVLARLDEVGSPPPPAARIDARSARLLPKPLHDFVGAGLDSLRWRSVGGMFSEARLVTRAKGLKVALMRLKPGALMPKHSHRGNEYTLVLAGGYHDNGVAYARGDFDVRSPDHVHEPVVDADGECLCLVVLDAPVKLTGAVGLFVNPFLRI